MKLLSILPQPSFPANSQPHSSGLIRKLLKDWFVYWLDKVVKLSGGVNRIFLGEDFVFSCSLVLVSGWSFSENHYVFFENNLGSAWPYVRKRGLTDQFSNFDCSPGLIFRNSQRSTYRNTFWRYFYFFLRKIKLFFFTKNCMQRLHMNSLAFFFVLQRFSDINPFATDVTDMSCCPNKLYGLEQS